MLPEYQKHLFLKKYWYCRLKKKSNGDKIKDSKREVLSDQDLFVCLSAAFNISRNL